VLGLYRRVPPRLPPGIFVSGKRFIGQAGPAENRRPETREEEESPPGSRGRASSRGSRRRALGQTSYGGWPKEFVLVGPKKSTGARSNPSFHASEILEMHPKSQEKKRKNALAANLEKTIRSMGAVGRVFHSTQNGPPASSRINQSAHVRAKHVEILLQVLPRIALLQGE